MRKKTSRKKEQPKRRTTRFEMIAAESVQNHGHLSSTDVLRRRDVLTAEVSAADAELIELAAKTADVRGRRAKAEAGLAGIMQVMLNRP